MRRLTACLAALVCALPGSAQEPAQALEYYRLSEAFYEAYGAAEWEQAAELGAKALAISGVDGHLWLQYAQVLTRLQRHEQAIPAFMQAREKGSFTNKHAAAVAFGLASANARLDRKEEALKWLRESYDAGYRDIRMFRNSEFAGLKGDAEYDAMAADRDLTGLSRDEGLAHDLWFLDRELRRIHYDPYAVTPRAVLDAEYEAILAAIPNLSDEEFYVRARRYVALIGDGHTALRVNQWKGPDPRQLAVTFTKFTDGVFVTGATPEFKHLVGRRLVSFNSRRLDDLWPELRSLASIDNEYDVVAQGPVYLTYASITKGMGLAKGDDVALTLQAGDGGITEVRVPFEQAPAIEMAWQSLSEKPLYLQNPQKTYWYTYLEGERTVYLQYNAVRSDGDEPIGAFMERVLKETSGKPIDKFVLDVRFNGGGNSFLNSNIQRPVMRNQDINVKGRLFIITGRQTFSAAQNFTTDFARESEAIFVGEPTGSRPNFVGESVPVVLPFTQMRMTVSDLYWQRSWPMDHRMWIPPDIPTEMSSAMFLAGRDPAMEAVLAFGKG
jgi:hypothetical protein